MKFIGVALVDKITWVSSAHFYDTRSAYHPVCPPRKYGTVPGFAWHPCTGAALIFSVSFHAVCAAEASTAVASKRNVLEAYLAVTRTTAV